MSSGAKPACRDLTARQVPDLLLLPVVVGQPHRELVELLEHRQVIAVVGPPGAGRTAGGVERRQPHARRVEAVGEGGPAGLDHLVEGVLAERATDDRAGLGGEPDPGLQLLALEREQHLRAGDAGIAAQGSALGRPGRRPLTGESTDSRPRSTPSSSSSGATSRSTGCHGVGDILGLVGRQVAVGQNFVADTARAGRTGALPSARPSPALRPAPRSGAACRSSPRCRVRPWR